MQSSGEKMWALCEYTYRMDKVHTIYISYYLLCIKAVFYTKLFTIMNVF